MMNLEIAGIPIGISNKYEFSDWLFLGHETDRTPLWKISASDEEITTEYERIQAEFDIVQAERNILYRKICFGMLEYDGFLIHAAAVSVDGDAYLFTAPSGTGKTTHSAYWMQVFGSRATMINGDKPIIRRIDGCFHVCGTPWRGKEQLGSVVNIPLKAVCLLERGVENSITRASDDEIVDRIFRQIPMPKDADQIIKQLELLNQLIKEVPVYRLKCNLSPEAALVAYYGINQSPATED